MNAKVCARNEHVDVLIESVNIGMRNRSTGRSGKTIRSWRRYRTNPAASVRASSAAMRVGEVGRLKLSRNAIKVPNVIVLKIALTTSKACVARGVSGKA